MALNLATIINGINAASNLGTGVMAMFNGITGGLNANSAAVTAVQQLLSQLQVVTDDPTAVAAIATEIQTTPGAPLAAVLLAKQLKDAAAASPYDPMHVLSVASMIQAAVAGNSQATNAAAQLAFAQSHLTRAIVAKAATTSAS